MDLFFLAIVIIVFLLLIPTYIIKHYKKGKTYYRLFSVVRFKKPLTWFDKFLFLGRFLTFFSELGILVGFGMLGADYLYGRKQKKLKRLFILVISFLFLFVVFEIFLSPLFSSPFTENYAFLFPFVFSLFGLGGFIFFALAMSAFDILVKLSLGIKTCPGVAPVIPGIKIPNVPIEIPWYAWIPLFLILIIHEGSHGILARKIGVKIKSTGILLAGIFPIGAFVEPHEQQLKKSSKIKQLRLFASGPMSNLLAIGVGMIVSLILFSFLLVPVIDDLNSIHFDSVKHIEIIKVNEKVSLCGQDFPSPSFGKFEEGMILLGVNGNQVKTTSDVFREIPRGPEKEASFLLEKNGAQKTFTLTSNALGLFGFEMKEVEKEGFVFPPHYTTLSLLLSLLAGILVWFILLNFLFAVVNFLPLEPFDGGKMAKIIILPYLTFWKIPDKKKEEKLNRIMIRVLLILFIINALPLFL